MMTAAEKLNENPESFSDRVARERAESRQRYKELHEGVAAHMPGWTAVETESETWDGMYSHRLVSGKHQIDLSRSKGKVNVSGYWPKRDSNIGTYVTPRDVQETHPDISISESRGYEAIAKDIKRRFLPEYFRIFAKIEEKIAAEQAYSNRKLSGWNRIVAECPNLTHVRTSKGDDEHRATIAGGGYHQIRMHGDNSLTFELRGVSVDTAIAILKALELQGGAK